MGVTVGGTVAADPSRNANNCFDAKISSPQAKAAGRQHSAAAISVVRISFDASRAASARVCPGIARSHAARIDDAGAAEDAKRRFENNDRRAEAERPRHDVIGERVDENVAQRESAAARDRPRVGLKKLYEVAGKAAQPRRHRAAAEKFRHRARHQHRPQYVRADQKSGERQPDQHGEDGRHVADAAHELELFVEDVFVDGDAEAAQANPDQIEPDIKEEQPEVGSFKKRVRRPRRHDGEAHKRAGSGQQHVEQSDRRGLSGGLPVGLAGQMRGAQLHEQYFGEAEVAKPKRVSDGAHQDEEGEPVGVRTRANTSVWINPVAKAPPAVDTRSNRKGIETRPRAGLVTGAVSADAISVCMNSASG